MPAIVMQQRFRATPTRVFDALTDHVASGRLVGADIRIERPGTPSPNGLGAVRAVRARGVTVREEVVRWEPPHAMDYRVIAGAPLQRHLGELRIAPEGDGARLDYRISFDWPWWLGGAAVGGIVVRQIGSQIASGLMRLATQLR